MEGANEISAIAPEPVSEVKYYYYSKRHTPVDPLARNPPPSPSRRTLRMNAGDACNSAEGLLEVGGFYELDHDQPLPKSPIHLKSIRVVQVSEKTRLNITVSFPSAFSLRKFFQEMNAPIEETTLQSPLQHPELDEQFVVGVNNAGRILRRLIPHSEVEEEAHLERFWFVDPKTQQELDIQPLAAATDEEDKDECSGIINVPVGSCLLALKRAGVVGWGVRRKIKYIGRHREESSSLVGAVKEEGMVVEGCGNIGSKRVRVISQDRKKKKKEDGRIKRLKLDRERTSDRRVFKAPKDRWSSERYEAAELKLLGIMKVKGAVLGNPILRPELREEARKHIGDTGLLDHLLKHMAGKVVTEGKERFRRRHNPEGAMEYWLEPAELQEMRRTAGVMDPFWVPPPGWKPGDTISPFGAVCGREIDHLKEELATLRRDVEWLRSLGLHEKEVQDAQSRADAANILKLQESCESLSRSNAKLEEQLAAMATCLKVMQDEMRLLELGKEKKEVERQEEKSRGVGGDSGRDDGKPAKGTRAANNNSESSGSRVVRRSGFRICKPQGTFLWPSMGSGAGICSGPNGSASRGNGSSSSSMMSSPSVMVSAEDPSAVPPTPRSASSATSPRRLVLPGPSVSAPRAQVVVVAPRPHQRQQQQQQLPSGERTASSDNICFPTFCSHMRASAFTQYGGSMENWEPDGRSGVWSSISTDLALSSPCYHR